MTVALERLLVERLLDVQEHPGPQHAIDAVNLGAMRIFHGLALGVVLAVDRRPFLGDHAGGEPEPEAEKMRYQGMELKGPMRLAAMEIDRDGGDRDVRKHERGDDVAPPRKVQ